MIIEILLAILSFAGFFVLYIFWAAARTKFTTYLALFGIIVWVWFF